MAPKRPVPGDDLPVDHEGDSPEKWSMRLKKAIALRILYLGVGPYKAINKWGNRTLGYEVGEYTYGAPKVVFPDGRLKIGKFCSIGWEVIIFLGGNHRVDWISTYPFHSSKGWPEVEGLDKFIFGKGDVTIGNDVWIGSNVIIMSGITIGDGAVIGTGSVVTDGVKPYTIVAGNPARAVKQRFTDEQIAGLLEIKWWDWPVDKIRENIPVLCSGNVERFLECEKMG
jgi:acetyltransferase-like isoleucine patch superfamily enzyme